ncbi:14745_t:CDS:2, partial [Funneliformis mosseae]
EPLSWPNCFNSDKKTEYLGDCKSLLLKHGVKIRYAKTKKEHSRDWARSLHANDDIFNNTPTRLINMSPNKA